MAGVGQTTSQPNPLSVEDDYNYVSSFRQTWKYITLLLVIFPSFVSFHLFMWSFHHPLILEFPHIIDAKAILVSRQLQALGISHVATHLSQEKEKNKNKNLSPL